VKRSKHTLSNYRLLTCEMGNLIPIGLQEALPGDTFQLSSSAMVRVSPLAAPVMHPVTVRIHHFFVPHRLLWSGWEDFITGGPDGMNATSPPTVTVPGTVEGTLFDYLGIPDNANGCAISALPLNGINLIWNEYYRDQDLQSERTSTDPTLPSIAWGKDYFTTARPWSQKGPDITVPIGDKAPVMGLTTNPAATWAAVGTARDGSGTIRSQPPGKSTQVGTWGYVIEDPDHPGYPGAYADLSMAGAANINDFRRAFALQRYQEARAQYGSRYTEYLRYLGVTPSDARLQRPEYIGGGSTRLNFSEVLQTAQADNPDRETYGVGDLYGHGVAGLRSGRVRRFIEEHGYIHSFISVRPRGIYQNGINRTFLKKTKEDFFQKELQYIGQQEVLDNEVYAKSTNTDAHVFGYSDRYAEYRSTPSLVTGEFRNLLDYWHMARQLPDTTTLNEDFVKCVPTKRIYNVQTNDVLWIQVNNNVVARRMVGKTPYARIL